MRQIDQVANANIDGILQLQFEDTQQILDQLDEMDDRSRQILT